MAILTSLMCNAAMKITVIAFDGCMTSAVRVLRGPARLAAAPAAVIVAVVLGYCGWALLAPLAVVLAVCSARPLATAAGPMRKWYESR